MSLRSCVLLCVLTAACEGCPEDRSGGPSLNHPTTSKPGAATPVRLVPSSVSGLPALRPAEIAGLYTDGAQCLRELRNSAGERICSGVIVDEGASPCIEVEDLEADGTRKTTLFFGSGCINMKILSGYCGWSMYYLEMNGHGFTFICEDAPVSHVKEWNKARLDCYRQVGRPP
jgi:hypothetical protein